MKETQKRAIYNIVSRYIHDQTDTNIKSMYKNLLFVLQNEIAEKNGRNQGTFHWEAGDDDDIDTVEDTISLINTYL